MLQCCPSKAFMPHNGAFDSKGFPAKGDGQMPASRRRKANITVSDAALRGWHRSGLRLSDIQRKIFESTGWKPDISTISKWLKDMGEEPRRKSRKEFLPWTVQPEHRDNRWRIMLEAAGRRAAGQDLSETDQKAVNLLDDYLFGRGIRQVVGYHPEIGFYRADATPEEIEQGRIVRTPEANGLDGSTGSDSLDLTLEPAALAKQALKLGFTPEQLEDVGRSPAADILRDLLGDSRPTPRERATRKAAG